MTTAPSTDLSGTRAPQFRDAVNTELAERSVGRAVAAIYCAHPEAQELFGYVYPDGFGRREWMLRRTYSIGLIGVECSRCGERLAP